MEHWSLTSSRHIAPVTTTTIFVSSSATPAPAVLHWGGSDNKTQLFFQLSDGTIKLKEFDGRDWVDRTPTGAQIEARNGSGLAAISWLEGTIPEACKAFITRLLPILTLFFSCECIPWIRKTIYRNLVRAVLS